MDKEELKKILQKEFPDGEVSIEYAWYGCQDFEIEIIFTTNGLRWGLCQYWFTGRESIETIVNLIRKQKNKYEKNINLYDENKVKCFLKDYLELVRKYKIMFDANEDDLSLKESYSEGEIVLSNIDTKDEGESISAKVSFHDIYTANIITVR